MDEILGSGEVGTDEAEEVVTGTLVEIGDPFGTGEDGNEEEGALLLRIGDDGTDVVMAGRGGGCATAGGGEGGGDRACGEARAGS